MSKEMKGKTKVLLTEEFQIIYVDITPFPTKGRIKSPCPFECGQDLETRVGKAEK